MNNTLYRISTKLVCLLCALSMLFAFASCNGDGEGDETLGEIYHTITFNTNGGSTVDSVQVRDGYYALRPEDPTLDNYVFRRWETDGREWLFEAKKVTKSMTLSALWVPAIELFELTPEENGSGLVIVDFKKAASFSTLKIPSVINGKNIVGLADGAFANTGTDHASVIVIPETIVSVGNEAFKDSSEIKFDIKGTLTSIGEASFQGCKLLDKIKLGEGMTTIPFMAFFECSSLKTIAIPEGVTTIEENAFEGCSSLVTVVLPASLESVEDSGFAYCSSLKTVFYKGTEEQLDAIEISDSNESLANAKVYFYSETEPTEEGLWWHFDSSNSPVIW